MSVLPAEEVETSVHKKTPADDQSAGENERAPQGFYEKSPQMDAPILRCTEQL